MSRVLARLRIARERLGLLLSQPFAGLRRRMERWIAAHTPRSQAPLAISRRRVYIVPTRYGYIFAIMLLVMLLGAMNYSNSMAFALTFLLAGIGLIGMHHTHANLVELRILGMRAAPVFAGDTCRFELRLENGSLRARFALAAAWNRHEIPAPVDLPALSQQELALALTADRRGWLPAPRFAIATEFPLGLFHAWTWMELEAAALIYPRPADEAPTPPASGSGGSGAGQAREGQEEFDGLRSYQRGDSSGRIHWKSLSRLPPSQTQPQVKHFNDPAQSSLWLDWQAMPPAIGIEERLSLLTRWVLDADAAGRGFGLRLPGFERAPASGTAHRDECLKALALFDGGARAA